LGGIEFNAWAMDKIEAISFKKIAFNSADIPVVEFRNHALKIGATTHSSALMFDESTVLEVSLGQMVRLSLEEWDVEKRA